MPMKWNKHINMQPCRKTYIHGNKQIYSTCVCKHVHIAEFMCVYISLYMKKEGGRRAIRTVVKDPSKSPVYVFWIENEYSQSFS